MGRPLTEYESGQTQFAFEAMTPSADRKTFSASLAPFSDGVVIAPYGLLTGGAIAATGSNDQVSVAALTVQAPGMAGANAEGVVAVSSGNVTIQRGAASDTHRITSITVDNAGALAAVSGEDGTGFDEDRGVAGGPPYIPAGSIEIGQVRTTSIAAAAVDPSEIMTTIGIHRESATFPGFSVSDADGQAEFFSALPAIHTGDAAKLVYVKGATPQFAPVPGSSDFLPAEETVSVSSSETHQGTVNDVSFAVGTSTFNARMKQTEAISGDFVSKRGQNIWIRYYPDSDISTVYTLTQGYLAISRPFPTSGGDVTVACTLGATAASRNVAT